MSEKTKSKKIKPQVEKLRYYNIAIQPADKQNADNYVSLFRKLLDLKSAVKVGREKFMRVRTMDFADDFIHGDIITYEQLGPEDWYNSADNVIQDVPVDENLHPRAHDIHYYFRPGVHCMALDASIPVKQVITFLQSAIAKAEEALGYGAAVNVISTTDSVNSIIEAKELTRLVVRVSYSNADNYDDWAQLLDNDMKDTNVSVLRLEATGKRGNPIVLKANKIFMAMLKLVRKNGTAIATSYENGRRKIISTQTSPEQIDIPYTSDEQRLKNIKQSIGKVDQ